jgi:hypothetical protein
VRDESIKILEKLKKEIQDEDWHDKRGKGNVLTGVTLCIAKLRHAPVKR